MNTIGEHNVGRYQEIQHSLQQFREIGGGWVVGGGGGVVGDVCVCVCVGGGGGGGGGGSNPKYKPQQIPKLKCFSSRQLPLPNPLKLILGVQTPSISHSKSQNLNVSRLVNCLYPIHWSQVLSPEWRYSWSNANRRCSNYIWVINKVIAY